MTAVKTSTKRILVGTLYCGENEFEACRDSLAEQEYEQFEHFVLENLPNREAHRRLYNRFRESRNGFDLFLKLDADMVLKRPDALTLIARYFEADAELDHLQMKVADWPSQQAIWGVHAFSSRANWNIRSNLFVDPPPIIPGNRLLLEEAPAPFVSHCENPSPRQAWALGVHRASKALQKGQKWGYFDRANSLFQWHYLCHVWRHYKTTQDSRCGLTIQAAEAVLRNLTDHHAYDGKGSLRDMPENLDERALQPWRRPLYNNWRYASRVAFPFLVSVTCGVLRRITRAKR